MKNKIIACNWKMNFSLDEYKFFVKNFIKNYKKHQIENKLIILPPYVYIYDFYEKIKRYEKISLGSQDLFYEEDGAYSGKISGKMIKSLGCRYALIGHSECRKFEDEKNISKKINIAIKNSLIPFVCFGENLDEKKRSLIFLKDQIKKSFDKVEKTIETLFIAYEPIFSIGTGIVPKNQEINENIIFIKETLEELKLLNIQNCKFFYGGSCNEKSVLELCKIDILDGFLIGGASIKLNSLFEILKILNK